MKLEVDITKSKLFILISSILLFTACAFAFAYGSNTPAIFGHSPSEIGPGRFTNYSEGDSWIFPGDIVIEKFKGNGNKQITINSEGILTANDFPVPDTDLILIEDFFGKPASWTSVMVGGTGASVASEFNHPGLYRIYAGSTSSDYANFFISEAISADQLFDVNFLIKSNSTGGFVSQTGFTIGLFDSSTTNGAYASQPKIAFEAKEAAPYATSRNWLAVTATSGTRPSGATITNTTVPLSAYNTWVKLRITRLDRDVIQFYINDLLVANHSSNIPISSSSMHIGMQVPSGSVIIDSFRLKIRNIQDKVLDCPTTPLYDSMVGSTTNISNKPLSEYKDVPLVCLSPVGCIIKQEIYSSKGLSATRNYDYYQNPLTGSWSSSYQIGKSFINGDAVYTPIIPAYDYLYLHDDKAILNGEIDRSRWTFYDNTASYGHKIFVCSLAE